MGIRELRALLQIQNAGRSMNLYSIYIQLRNVFLGFLLTLGVGWGSACAQTLGYAFGDDKFVQLSGPNNALKGTVSEFDLEKGFVHQPISAQFSADKKTLTIQFPQDLPVEFVRRANRDNGIVFFDPQPSVDPARIAPLAGFASVDDNLASQYLDYYNKNIESRAVPAEPLADYLTLLTDLCKADESDIGDLARIVKSSTCDSWAEPLSMGIVTPRSALAGWRTAAGALNIETRVRTIDAERAVLVADPRLIGTLLGATNGRLQDASFDARDTSIITAKLSPAERFNIKPLFPIQKPPFHLEFTGEITGSPTIFETIQDNPWDEASINLALQPISRLLSSQGKCEFSARTKPRIICIHHEGNKSKLAANKWVISFHTLKIYTVGPRKFVESNPFFKIANGRIDETPGDFADPDYRDKKEIAAINLAICNWKTGVNRAYMGRVNFDTRDCE